MLQIYNTLTRAKAPFKPITPGKVKIYVCGITVYDYCHLGHARTYIAFDTIIRYLKFRGYEVYYVRNITDIDDKIIERAQANNETVPELTERFIAAMHQDFAALNLLPADIEPRATEYIPQMIRLMQDLEAKGYAYQAENSDVYFDVRKFTAYGQLSHRKLDDLQAGMRVEVNTAKNCPLDFVLWKTAKLGEPAWSSPWGDGRPGWHSECTVMAMQHLGETFDLHGGGIDLSFPHHENECAQAEAISGKKFVNTWMHAGFLQINQEKMSKSLGNFATVHSVLHEVHPEELRFFMLTGHYRSSLEYSPQQVALSRSGLERFYIALRDLPLVDVKFIDVPEHAVFMERFVAAMDDDFNTPEALAVLFDLAKEINKCRADTSAAAQEAAVSFGRLLKHLGGILGLLQCDPAEFLHDLTGMDSNIDVAEIERLIQRRTSARASGNWAEADQVRAQLTTLGISLEDTAAGTIWRRGGAI